MDLTEFHGPKVRRGCDGCSSSTPPGKGGLGKDFDSLTPKHQLRDAKEEYEQAVYRFRDAEQTNSPDLIALKREIEFLGCKLWAYRRWFYSGESIEEYVELPAPSDRCPKPAWV